MLKFKTGSKSSQSNGDTNKSTEQFCALNKISSYGFPHKPTALAWDPYLSLMAIGTNNGNIRIFGAPGVYFSAQQKQPTNIIHLIFIPKKGSLISICSDNTLHLWELKDQNGTMSLIQTNSFVLSGLMKKITSVYLKSTSDILFLGTMCGNIYTLDVQMFEMADSVIYQDVVMQNIPDHVKLSQGCVKVISQQVGKPDCLLIGYEQGLMVLWDLQALIVASIFVASQSLESVAWRKSGDRFISCHNDGSYVIWSIDDPSKPAEIPMTPYGPFACKSINKIIWNSVKGGEDFIIFNGGMPRAVHGEKFTLTIMCGEKHEVLSLSSKVIDFFTIAEYVEGSAFDNPHSLVILLEEELIVLDLESEGWLPYKLPYLDIPHSSPVTCVQFCHAVHKNVAKIFADISQSQFYMNNCSKNEWPIKGGTNQESSAVQSLLITGHENGSVKLWNLGVATMKLLYTFHTMNSYITYERNDDSEELDDWPPFRKIGDFDSLSDDPRLAIRKLVFHDITRTLVIGGSAGQISVLKLTEEIVEKEIKPIIIHLVGDYNTAMFSTHVPLMVKPGLKKYEKGFHLHSLIQLTPPAAITALAYHAEWNILAAGTSHGFMLFDVVQKKSIMSKCTVTAGADMVIGSSEITPKSNTLKRSLRDSFRKLRKGKGLIKQGRDRSGSLSIELQAGNTQSLKRESYTSSPDPTFASSPSPELRSFSSETDSGGSSLGSVVQCVYLAQSFIINNVITTPTFWAGTSNGYVCIYSITLPTTDCRATETVTCHLGKEIQLKHRAPVLSIQIIDHNGYPLPDPIDVQQQRAKPADLGRSHRVVICTEEQMKVLTLPSLKTFCKYKISLLEQGHATQIGYSTVQNKADSKTVENCLVTLNNSCEIGLYSLPDIRKLCSFQCVSTNQDSSLLSHFLFSRDGRFLHMSSLSEFELFSMSSAHNVKSMCSIHLPKNVGSVSEPEDNVILQVHQINTAQTQVNESRESNLHLTTISNPDVPSEISNDSDETLHRNQVQIFSRRAPLARIDELNLSDEHNFSNHNGVI